jgi:L-ascorbate metabolism protein UlaG (beta-lactamase superfamily)
MGTHGESGSRANAAGVLLLLLLVTLLALTACGGSSSAAAPSSAAAASSPSAASPSASPQTTPAAPKSGVMLRWEGTAQVELTASGSPRVLIDIQGPSSLSAPPTADDILLTTHDHPDHVSHDFIDSFPGTQLFVQEGRIEKPGVAIRGIAAAHTQGDPLVPEGGTDYIFVIDMGGLRIVHFGDIGQPALTPQQAKAVGRVDVAVTQFDNAQFSDIDVKNKKGFRLMEQVKPWLIVQTHSSLAAVKYAATLWPVLYSKRPSVTVTAAELPKKTSLLLLGEEGAYYVESGVHARKVDW